MQLVRDFMQKKPAFAISAGAIIIILLISVLFKDQVEASTGWLFAHVIRDFGWFFVLSMSFFLAISLICCFSSFGDIRLGADNDRPEFSYLSWLSMLFSAGMGIGLLFYGVAEPILHFAKPAPPIVDGTAMVRSAQNAMGLTFFHWGLHPWACYSVFALIIAYFSFRKGKSISIRNALYPLLGDRVNGLLGDIIDSIAIVATLFGVATSLGLGSAQINSGFHTVFGLPESVPIQITIIAVVTGFAMISVVSGLKKGIRLLSEANMFIAAFLLLATLVLGPTSFLLDFFVENIGSYLSTLIRNSFWTASLNADRQQWLGSWTIFYWAWWVSWSPFVGTFLARISRGRTVREFVVGVLLVPTAMCLIWFTVFGGTALYNEINQNGPSIIPVVKQSTPQALFVFLGQFPIGGILKILATISVILFFVTSSDSASLIIDILSSGGKLVSGTATKIFWAVTEGAIAAMLLSMGGLKALQTATICIGLPFCVILVMGAIGLVKELRREITASGKK